MTGMRTIHNALQPNVDAAWILDQPGFDSLRDGSRESRFAISNGFLGVRGGRTIDRPQDSIVAPCTYVAGLFDSLGGGQPVSALVPAPDWLRVCISHSATSSNQVGDERSFHHRTLDLKRGALLTESRLESLPDVSMRVRVLRIVSLRERGLGLQLVQLNVEVGGVEATLEADFEGLEFGLLVERLEQGLGVWRTKASGKRFAMAAIATLWVDGQVLEAKMLSPFRQAWTWITRSGQEVYFARMVSVTREDTPIGDPGVEAGATLAAAWARGWNDVLASHEVAWAARWQESDVAIRGDPAAQQALRFALYHLNGAANPSDDRVSIAARALTGNDYRGHVFWDTEIFLLPFYTFTWPEAARALLSYRYRTLDAARAKSKQMGWRGALYAWESADTGVETTPEQVIAPDRHIIKILCGTQEQHISADIAYAVWHYWQVSGDDEFLRTKGAEIMLETARFWASRARLEPDGLHHIRGVIGPDEYHETIDDNAFTNVMARWNIRQAISVATLMKLSWPAAWEALRGRIGLDDEEIVDWKAVADAMATGLDPRTGLFEQFTGFFALEHIDLANYAGRTVPMDVVLGRARTKAAQIVKQADVVALLALLPGEFGGAAAANFDYYEPRCSHGSSLSAAMHGLTAARLGRSDIALRYFRQTASTDLADNKAAIDGGIHIASLGGIWMMAVQGFAGLTTDEDGIRLNPQLPDGWEGLSFKVQWRRRHLSIGIDRLEGTILATLISGEPLYVSIDAIRHRLGETPVVIALANRCTEAVVQPQNTKALHETHPNLDIDRRRGASTHSRE